MATPGSLLMLPTWPTCLPAMPRRQQTRMPCLKDRAHGVLLGLAAGNLLDLPVEGRSHRDIAARYPNGVTEIDPTEARRPLEDRAQAVSLAEAHACGRRLCPRLGRPAGGLARENGRGLGVTTREVIRELESGYPLPEPARSRIERAAHSPGWIPPCRSRPASCMSDGVALLPTAG